MFRGERRGCGPHARAARLLVVLFLAVGCARRSEPPAAERVPLPAGAHAVRLPVHVYADTGRGTRLEVPLHREAQVWLARVSPTRLPPPSPPLPRALPESLPPLEESPPTLEVDPGLKPPVLRRPGVLALPPAWRGARGSVDLDVRVDESGRVSDVVWTGGIGDTALVAAARRCALGMTFYPALRAGRPVAVWCRQRFDLGGAER